MARLCDTCLNFSLKYDEFRQQFDDIEIVREPKQERHYCPMYDAYIPDGIYFDGQNCEYYFEQEGATE